ncbi:MAG TPA: DUF6629 family protein [Lacipirellulaceae bacterium]|nr:DUF6629 family protein [Lacipirellulaceae bacterium]
MCFSATSSFVSGTVVGVVGIGTIVQVRHARELLLGALPLMFAAHQIEEGFVWLYLRGHVPQSTGNWAILLYIVFAHALLIAISPWSMWLIEPKKTRRWLLLPLVLLGTALCCYALWALFGAPVHAQIRRHGIEYDDPVTGVGWFAALYILATCAPPFLSSYPWMIIFGVLILVGLIVVATYKAIYLTSVWCAIAALVSTLIYVHFWRVRHQLAVPAEN